MPLYMSARADHVSFFKLISVPDFAEDESSLNTIFIVTNLIGQPVLQTLKLVLVCRMSVFARRS